MTSLSSSFYSFDTFMISFSIYLYELYVFEDIFKSFYILMRGVILEKLINNHCSEDVSVNKLGVFN